MASRFAILCVLSLAVGAGILGGSRDFRLLAQEPSDAPQAEPTIEIPLPLPDDAQAPAHPLCPHCGAALEENPPEALAGSAWFAFEPEWWKGPRLAEWLDEPADDALPGLDWPGKPSTMQRLLVSLGLGRGERGVQPTAAPTPELEPLLPNEPAKAILDIMEHVGPSVLESPMFAEIESTAVGDGTTSAAPQPSGRALLIEHLRKLEHDRAGACAEAEREGEVAVYTPSANAGPAPSRFESLRDAARRLSRMADEFESEGLYDVADRVHDLATELRQASHAFGPPEPAGPYEQTTADTGATSETSWSLPILEFKIDLD